MNGPGSSGKSSIAKALQMLTREPFLHVQMDAFLEMLPAALQDDAEGVTYEPGVGEGKPLIVIKTGPTGARLMDGMRQAIAAMAAAGNNLIVDEVLCNGGMPEYRKLLSPFMLHVVGVFAPLDVLEARERRRGDRLIGLARWQYDRVHAGIDYDFELDTAIATPLACAQRLKARFSL